MNTLAISSITSALLDNTISTYAETMDKHHIKINGQTSHYSQHKYKAGDGRGKRGLGVMKSDVRSPEHKVICNGLLNMIY